MRWFLHLDVVSDTDGFPVHLGVPGLGWIGDREGACQYSILIEASVKKNAPGAENNFCMIENYVLF